MIVRRILAVRIRTVIVVRSDQLRSRQRIAYRLRHIRNSRNHTRNRVRVRTRERLPFLLLNQILVRQMNLFILSVVDNIIPVGETFIQLTDAFLRRFELRVIGFDLFVVFRLDRRDLFVDFLRFGGIGRVGIGRFRQFFQLRLRNRFVVQGRHNKQVSVGGSRFVLIPRIDRQGAESENIGYALPHFDGNLAFVGQQFNLVVHLDHIETFIHQFLLRFRRFPPIAGRFQSRTQTGRLAAHVDNLQIVQRRRKRGELFDVQFFVFRQRRILHLTVRLGNQVLSQRPGRGLSVRVPDRHNTANLTGLLENINRIVVDSQFFYVERVNLQQVFFDPVSELS